MAYEPSIMVDRTHLDRRSSGIERITRELFSEAALAPLPVEGWEAGRARLSMIANQRLAMPVAALARPRTLWIFSGYPPAPILSAFPERSVLYVHDLFLITRNQDLNRSAKLYMVRPFRQALARLRYFLVNSLATGAVLRDFVRPDARILPYRPPIRDVFGVSGLASPFGNRGGPLVVGAMGTIEPRKNFRGAALLCTALAERLGRSVELHIIGRSGWGDDAVALAQLPHVRLLGFLDEAEVRRAIGRFDLFLCNSHDEGLGLPLLEMQFAGLLVAAPDKKVFREVLDESGLLLTSEDPAEAVRVLAERLLSPDWRQEARALAERNLQRWNRQAEQDRAGVVAFLGEQLAALQPSR